MIYLLIKVGVNKALIVIKSIFKTLKVRYHNGKVEVCLCGGIGFESYPMHVINILIFLFYLLYVIKSVILYLHLHVVYEIHYDNVWNLIQNRYMVGYPTLQKLGKQREWNTQYVCERKRQRPLTTSDYVLVLAFVFRLAHSLLTLPPALPSSALPHPYSVGSDSYSSLWLLPLHPSQASSAIPKSNSSSDLVFRVSSLPVLLPLKFGISRCCKPSALENCHNLSKPSGLVKTSAVCQFST